MDNLINTKYNVINLGAGVQSSTMALMAAKGEIGPMPDFAVFADTQAEPQEVYDWLDWLETQLPFKVYRVTKGNLTEDSLAITVREDGSKMLRRNIPVFGLSPSGEMQAALGRKCTRDYKIRPIISKIKEECNIRRGQDEVTVTQWIGISYDEIQRMRLPDDKWTQHRWPLIEKKMLRAHCLEWMKANGYPEPPRSACYYCPFHTDEEWRRLKKESPVFFSKAVEFDHNIRKLFLEEQQDFKMKIFLHRSCKPLDQVDFDTPEDKGQLNFDFQSECEGMCGL